MITTCGSAMDHGRRRYARWLTLAPSAVQAFPSNPPRAYVLDTGGTLWGEIGPWGADKTRHEVDTGVSAFQGIGVLDDGYQVFVLDQTGDLYYEFGPWGTNRRNRFDGNVRKFQMIGETEIYVLGDDGRLWLEHLGPPGLDDDPDADRRERRDLPRPQRQLRQCDRHRRQALVRVRPLGPGPTPALRDRPHSAVTASAVALTASAVAASSHRRSGWSPKGRDPGASMCSLRGFPSGASRAAHTVAPWPSRSFRSRRRRFHRCRRTASPGRCAALRLS